MDKDVRELREFRKEILALFKDFREDQKNDNLSQHAQMREETRNFFQTLREDQKEGFKEVRDSCSNCNTTIHSRISTVDTKVEKLSTRQNVWLGGVIIVGLFFRSFGNLLLKKLGF